MSFVNLLNHQCNIYHLREGETSPGYGLAASPSFAYPDKPDVCGQICHFGVGSQNVSITQGEPANIMEAKIKLTLPVAADVRLHDKIVDCATGLEYTAEQPVNVRNHHIFVLIKRKGGQRAL
ncbi:MAG: DUF3599 family protein [Firmicutes bacterium]|nr:DUF3599 family protein [Bacillota bacterium]